MTVELRQREEDGRLVLRVQGEVDMETAPRLWRELERALRRSPRVAVDLQGVSYIDSSGVAALVQGLKEARRRNGLFVLVHPSEQTMSVLRLARLDRVFDIEADHGDDGAAPGEGSSAPDSGGGDDDVDNAGADPR